MGKNKKNRKTKSKEQDGAFPSKNINHDPQAESARTKFGLDTVGDGDRNNLWEDIELN